MSGRVVAQPALSQQQPPPLRSTVCVHWPLCRHPSHTFLSHCLSPPVKVKSPSRTGNTDERCRRCMAMQCQDGEREKERKSSSSRNDSSGSSSSRRQQRVGSEVNALHDPSFMPRFRRPHHPSHTHTYSSFLRLAFGHLPFVLNQVLWSR